MVITFITFPPYYFATTRSYIFRFKIAIFGRVPLRCNCRIKSFKIICFTYFLSRAIGTFSILISSNSYICFPFMVITYITFPSYYFSTTISEVFRFKVAIFGRVPFFCDFRIDYFYIICFAYSFASTKCETSSYCSSEANLFLILSFLDLNVISESPILLR